MNEYITNELIETTYLFCVKRISDTEAAKDLSQDILFEAIRVIADGKEFASFYSWYWKMARNKYADYIAHKRNCALPIESIGGMAAETPLPIESIIDAEDISQLNFSLSRLASIHREVIIRFYLKEQSVSQIAEELDIPAGTVKSRLFDAKKNLKSRFDNMTNIGKTAYAPADIAWFWGYSAMNASLLMDSSKICPQIMIVCKNEAKTVNEIADEMGIAPVYLEEILEKMEKEQLLKSPAKGKYAANCCIFPKQNYTQAKLYANKSFFSGDFPKKITDKLFMLKDKITAFDFYGNHFDYKYLMWILCVIAGDAFGVIGQNHYSEKHQDKILNEAERKFRLTMQYTLPDETFDCSIYSQIKECNWSNLHQNFTTSDYGHLEFVNAFECEPFPNDRGDDNDWRCGRDRWVDGNNISLLLELAKNPEKELSVHEEAKSAEFIKNGLLKKENGKLIVQLPIIKRETYKKIEEIIRKELETPAKEFADIVSKGVEKILSPYVRKDLLSNFIYWDMRVFFQTINALFYHCWNDFLEKPDDYSTSAAGLYILTE